MEGDNDEEFNLIEILKGNKNKSIMENIDNFPWT